MGPATIDLHLTTVLESSNNLFLVLTANSKRKVEQAGLFWKDVLRKRHTGRQRDKKKKKKRKQNEERMKGRIQIKTCD